MVRAIDFIVLLVGTIAIAAAGNIVNDIYDLEIDLINKPDRVIIGKVIQPSRAWIGYFFLNALALMLALGTGLWGLSLFFVAAIGLLYGYAAYWKRAFLIGNLVIAFLCALVVIEFWWLAMAYWGNYWTGILWAYAAFAFFSTLARELIKDIEDIEGDRAMACQTLPLQLGIPMTQKVVLGIWGILWFILCLEAWTLYLYHKWWALVYWGGVLNTFLAYLMYSTQNAQQKSTYTHLSHSAKIYMLLGLFLLFWI